MASKTPSDHSTAASAAPASRTSSILGRTSSLSPKKRTSSTKPVFGKVISQQFKTPDIMSDELFESLELHDPYLVWSQCNRDIIKTIVGHENYWLPVHDLALAALYSPLTVFARRIEKVKDKLKANLPKRYCNLGFTLDELTDITYWPETKMAFEPLINGVENYQDQEFAFYITKEKAFIKKEAIMLINKPEVYSYDKLPPTHCPAAMVSDPGFESIFSTGKLYLIESILYARQLAIEIRVVQDRYKMVFNTRLPLAFKLRRYDVNAGVFDLGKPQGWVENKGSRLPRIECLVESETTFDFDQSIDRDELDVDIEQSKTPEPPALTPADALEGSPAAVIGIAPPINLPTVLTSGQREYKWPKGIRRMSIIKGPVVPRWIAVEHRNATPARLIKYLYCRSFQKAVGESAGIRARKHKEEERKYDIALDETVPISKRIWVKKTHEAYVGWTKDPTIQGDIYEQYCVDPYVMLTEKRLHCVDATDELVLYESRM